MHPTTLRRATLRVFRVEGGGGEVVCVVFRFSGRQTKLLGTDAPAGVAQTEGHAGTFLCSWGGGAGCIVEEGISFEAARSVSFQRSCLWRRTESRDDAPEYNQTKCGRPSQNCARLCSVTLILYVSHWPNAPTSFLRSPLDLPTRSNTTCMEP